MYPILIASGFIILTLWYSQVRLIHYLAGRIGLQWLSWSDWMWVATSFLYAPCAVFLQVALLLVLTSPLRPGFPITEAAVSFLIGTLFVFVYPWLAHEFNDRMVSMFINRQAEALRNEDR